MVTRLCIICGNEFKSMSKRTKCCSELCKKENIKLKRMERNKRMKELTEEQFWDEVAPVVSKENAIKKLEEHFNVIPQFAKLAYGIWRDSYKEIGG